MHTEITMQVIYWPSMITDPVIICTIHQYKHFIIGNQFYAILTSGEFKYFKNNLQEKQERDVDFNYNLRRMPKKIDIIHSITYNKE